VQNFTTEIVPPVNSAQKSGATEQTPSATEQVRKARQEVRQEQDRKRQDRKENRFKHADVFVALFALKSALEQDDIPITPELAAVLRENFDLRAAESYREAKQQNGHVTEAEIREELFEDLLTQNFLGDATIRNLFEALSQCMALANTVMEENVELDFDLKVAHDDYRLLAMSDEAGKASVDALSYQLKERTAEKDELLVTQDELKAQLAIRDKQLQRALTVMGVASSLLPNKGYSARKLHRLLQRALLEDKDFTSRILEPDIIHTNTNRRNSKRPSMQKTGKKKPSKVTTELDQQLARKKKAAKL
jgi:hypothetical protein